MAQGFLSDNILVSLCSAWKINWSFLTITKQKEDSDLHLDNFFAIIIDTFQH